MTEHDPKLNILAPIETRPKLDRLERLVRRSGGGRMTRAEALGLGGLALLAAAGCGGKTSTGGGGAASSSGASDALAGKPMESNLVIYNWSQYDDPSTYKSFKTENHVAVKETYYSSNDELLAKLQAGGTGYDIIVPSQNAVGELVQLGSLMKLDQALIPNASAVESSWVKTAYDPTGEYKVVKDFGVTGFFYNNKIITEKPTTMKQFYDLLPKYGKVGRTNLLDGAEEVVPLALMALGYDPNTGDPAVLDKAKSFLSTRPTTSTTRRPARSSSGRAGTAICGGSSRPARSRAATSPPCCRTIRPRSGPTTGASRPPRPIRWRRTRGSTTSATRRWRSRRWSTTTTRSRSRRRSTRRRRS
jgi:spermidine/putrescine transport system substrate-binding protein